MRQGYCSRYIVIIRPSTLLRSTLELKKARQLKRSSFVIMWSDKSGIMSPYSRLVNTVETNMLLELQTPKVDVVSMFLLLLRTNIKGYMWYAIMRIDIFILRMISLFRTSHDCRRKVIMLPFYIYFETNALKTSVN